VGAWPYKPRGAVRILSAPDSTIKSVRRHAHYTGEILKDHFLAIVSNKYVVSFVPRLLCCGRPAAIARLIVPIWIVSLKGEARRAISHVTIKRSEASPPLITHGDASRSVAFEAGVSRVIAAPLGLIPRPKFLRDPSAALVPVARRSCGKPLVTKAPAAFGVSRSDLIEASRDLGFAIAPKNPQGISPCARQSTYRYQPSVSVARNV